VIQRRVLSLKEPEISHNTVWYNEMIIVSIDVPELMLAQNDHLRQRFSILANRETLHRRSPQANRCKTPMTVETLVQAPDGSFPYRPIN
jgi:hypothetical protein